MRRARPKPNEELSFADLEMDSRATGSAAPGATWRSARPSSGCCVSSWRIRAASSRERLLDLVWGRDKEIEIRTVDVHVRRLRQALGGAGEPELIRTVRQAGYALDDEAA